MARPFENLAKRKPSGGRRRVFRARRAYERNGFAAETTIGPRYVISVRTRGGARKPVLRRADYANVADPVTKKISKAKILKVVRNEANRDYERRGVITRGAIIETELGNAKVSSRPGRDGVINAVLVSGGTQL